MHYGKAIAAQVMLREDASCGDQFEKLVSQIEALPDDLRGARALQLSSRLLELAAFELAGSLDSTRIGALIECAAELARQSSDCADSELAAMTVQSRVYQ
ncbi:hypothetical protein CEP88_03965 [Roseobacter denitrificans]|nr:hypothetical protein [Roseobacter denitrificans]AVL51836.1 hypothetical protein CEP88_03965 [Roseobacter denitrificans]SFF80804.1 hypothetical protein SAMN05443635_102325 [Roseobacter denitrificans OCh 114]